MDQLKILEILNNNKDLEFVRRIMEAKSYPTLPNRDGSESTHGMMWSGGEGRFYVYPSVVYDEEVMARLGPDTAYGRAMRLGDFIEFATLQEAYEFSKEYKKFDPFFEAQDNEVIYPKRKTIWKDLNTGPGDPGDSMGGGGDVF
jgi:hypothetical protein